MALKQRAYRPPPTICSLPWTAVETSPNGEARVCCLADNLITQPNGHPYNMSEHSLQDAFQSDYMKKLRQEFLDGKKPSTCNKCWSVEQAGGKSKRILEHCEFGPNSLPILRLWYSCSEMRQACILVHDGAVSAQVVGS